MQIKRCQERSGEAQRPALSGQPPSRDLHTFSPPEDLWTLSFWVFWKLHGIGRVADRRVGRPSKGCLVSCCLAPGHTAFLQGVGRTLENQEGLVASNQTREVTEISPCPAGGRGRSEFL